MFDKDCNIDAILYNTVIKKPCSYELINKVNAMNFNVTQKCSHCEYNSGANCCMKDLPIKSAPKSCYKNHVLFEFIVHDKDGEVIEQTKQNNTEIVNSIDFTPEQCIIDNDMWIVYKVIVTLL